MEVFELNQYISGAFDALKSAVVGTKAQTDYKIVAAQYNPDLHDVHNKAKRKNKEVTDDNGNTTWQPVNRLSVPIQEQIVQRAATFLCGNPVTLETLPADQLTEQEKALLSIVAKIWKDNKLDYDSKQIVELLLSEREVAELWFFEDTPPGYWKGTSNAETLGVDELGRAVKKEAQSRLRMKILANSKGDTMYPIFNDVGDMIAFVREYRTKLNGYDVPHFDMYTDTQIIKWQKSTPTSLEWQKVVVPNAMGKIPIIYYKKDRTEWHNILHLINRLEEVISNLADTNDYSGSPIVIVKGEVTGWSKKGERGKVLELEPGADASYLEANSAPESVRLEIETLLALIYDLTDTPNISFDQVKGLGAFSGVALRMIFMAAHMKASKNEEIVGKSMQRRLNLLKACAALMNITLEAGVTLEIRPKFDYYMPKNIEEQITLLNASVAGGILSVETAVHQNPLVENPEEEVKKIKAETKEASDMRVAEATSSSII